MSLYLGGRGKLGAFVAASAPPLALPLMASSGAGLAALALRLGGRPALTLLLSKAFGQLLKGFGSEQERGRLARAWLAQLHVPDTALLADLEHLGWPPLHLVLFDVERRAPVLLRGLDAEPLAHVAAALCSYVPVRVGSRRLLDAENVLPMEALAGAASPPPFLSFGPHEPPFRGAPALEFSGLVASFLERMLGAARGPVLRVPVPHLLETLATCGAPPPLRLEAAAAVCVYVAACLLRR